MMQRLHLVIATTRQFIADIADARLSVFAGSLVYITLLSLVPTLALSFSILHGLGIQNQLEPLLVELLSPLGERSASVVNNILQFVNNTNLKALGFMGVAMILYSGVSMVLKLEFALNEIWGVKETRSLFRRISYYLTMLLLGPITFFLAMAFMGSISDISFIKPLLELQYFSVPFYFLIHVVPFIIIIIALFMLYMIVPNHRVTAKSAFYAAIIAAFSWKITGWLFASFIAGSVNYNIIYSGFAVVVIFIFWVYLTWLIILAGGMVCAQIQYAYNPAMKSLDDFHYQDARLIRILLLLRICRAYFAEQKPLTMPDVIDYAGLPYADIAKILNEFEEKRLVVFARDNEQEIIIPNAAINTHHLGSLLKLLDCESDKTATLPGQSKFAEEFKVINTWYSQGAEQSPTLAQMYVNAENRCQPNPT